MANVRTEKPKTKTADWESLVKKFNQNLPKRDKTYDFTPGRVFTQKKSPLYD